MVAGRPRTVTPPTEELIKLGEELVTWATEETDELRCLFTQWYSIKKGILESEFDLMKRKEEFVPYYEKARAALSLRFINGSVKDGIAHRFLRIYCPEVKREEDETAIFNSNLKAQEQTQVTEADNKRHDALIAQIESLRSSRKISDSNTNAETKS